MKLIFLLGVKEISLKKVNDWATSKNKSMLLFALAYGNHKIRKQVITVLGKSRNPEVIPSLVKTTKDPIRSVSALAVNTLRKFPKTDLIEKAINEAEQFWAVFDKRNENKKQLYQNQQQVYKEPTVWFDKSKMKNLQRLKKQLAKTPPSMI